MNYYIKEYVKLVLIKEINNSQNQNYITWGDIKSVINKTKNKNLIKKVFNKMVSKGASVFMGINLPGTGEITDEICDVVLKKINSADASKIFISLCIDTKVFGELSSGHKKALSSIKQSKLLEVLNNILKEMKNVSEDRNMESIDFKSIFNSFLTPITNLEIKK